MEISFINFYLIVYLVIMILICCDAHWAEVTRANPLYVVYDEYAALGLWYRCIRPGYGNPGEGYKSSGGSYYCISNSTTIQVLPACLIIMRTFIIISIVSAAGSLITSLIANPLHTFKQEKKVKMLNITGATLLFSAILSLIGGIVFLVDTFKNNLGWIAGNNEPVEFVKSYAVFLKRLPRFLSPDV